jgi:hypothetical protein
LQAIKGDALGPHHRIDGLQSVAAEPWLSTVMEDAAKSRDFGWFWKYKINSIKV